VGHREEVRSWSRQVRAAWKAWKDTIHGRNLRIQAARADGVSVDVLTEESGLSREQIRRICEQS
jgi:hypothetical protein